MGFDDEILFDCIKLDDKNRQYELELAKAVSILRQFSFIFEANDVDKYSMEALRNEFLSKNSHIYFKLKPEKT